MTILHFASRQNDVFLPALAVLLVGALAVALPVVFAPTLRRSGRLRVAVVVGAVVAVAAIAVGAVQAGIGFRTLAEERASVGRQLADDYGLRLTEAQVGELIDGGKPDLAAVDGVLPKGVKSRVVRLVPQQADGEVYDVRVAGQVLQPTG